MQNPGAYSSGGIALRRRAAVAAAVAPLFRRRGPGVRDPHRQRGHRDALGQHVPLQPRHPRAEPEPGDARQPEFRRRRPQFLQRLAGHQPVRRAVRVRLRLAEEVRRSRVAPPAGTTRPTTAWTIPTPRPPTRWSTACRSPAQLSPYTKRYSKGAVGRVAGRVRVRQLRRGRHARQRQGGAAHRVLGRQPAAGRRRPRRVLRAEFARHRRRASRRPAPRPRSCSGRSGGLTLQAQPTNELSLAGQWFYNWQAVRSPESGSYLTVNDAAAVRRRLDDHRRRTRSPQRARLAGVLAGVERAGGRRRRATAAASATGACRRAGARQWLDGTLGFYGRNATDILPQQYADAGSAAGVPPATCTAIGGIAARPATLHHQPERDQRRRPDAEGQGRHLRLRPTATTSTSTASRCRRTSAG